MNKREKMEEKPAERVEQERLASKNAGTLADHLAEPASKKISDHLANLQVVRIQMRVV